MFRTSRFLSPFVLFTLLALLLVACAPATPAAAPMPKGTAAEAASMMKPTGDVSATEEVTDPSAAAALAGDTTMQSELAAQPAGDDTTVQSQPEAAMESKLAAIVAAPAWQQIALIDARTGATFTLADFVGKTVYVEPMATWCTNCRQQLGNVKEARAQLGEDVVVVALSVEPNIADTVLADYAAAAGFDWTFAGMPPALLQELAGLYGQTIANPPATPHFIIRPDGSTTELITGIDSPAAILEHIQAAQGG